MQYERNNHWHLINNIINNEYENKYYHAGIISPVDWHATSCEQYAGNAYDSDDQWFGIMLMLIMFMFSSPIIPLICADDSSMSPSQRMIMNQRRQSVQSALWWIQCEHGFTFRESISVTGTWVHGNHPELVIWAFQSLNHRHRSQMRTSLIPIRMIMNLNAMIPMIMNRIIRIMPWTIILFMPIIRIVSAAVIRSMLAMRMRTHVGWFSVHWAWLVRNTGQPAMLLMEPLNTVHSLVQDEWIMYMAVGRTRYSREANMKYFIGGGKLSWFQSAIIVSMKPANTARFSIMSLPHSFTDEHNALMKAHASMNDYIASMKSMFPYKDMLDDEILTQWLESCWHHNNMQDSALIPILATNMIHNGANEHETWEFLFNPITINMMLQCPSSIIMIITRNNTVLNGFMRLIRQLDENHIGFNDDVKLMLTATLYSTLTTNPDYNDGMIRLITLIPDACMMPFDCIPEHDNAFITAMRMQSIQHGSLTFDPVITACSDETIIIMFWMMRIMHAMYPGRIINLKHDYREHGIEPVVNSIMNAHDTTIGYPLEYRREIVRIALDDLPAFDTGDWLHMLSW